MSDLRRDWFVRLSVTCSQCGETDEAGVGSTSCEDARQNVMKVLRYRGWSIPQKKDADLCPEHAPTLPTCDLCADPTPEQYGVRGSAHVTGVPFACLACYRAKMDHFVKRRRAATKAAAKSGRRGRS